MSKVLNGHYKYHFSFILQKDVRLTSVIINNNHRALSPFGRTSINHQKEICFYFRKNLWRIILPDVCCVIENH